MKHIQYILFIAIAMPFPMLRLCGDAETNTVYAMCINPEFELISIGLE